MVVPMLEAADGTLRLVLERQYRYPVQRTLIEFPAGKIDPGEDTLSCARRELREETGYTATEWARAGVLHPVVAYSTEFIEIWFARGLTAGERRLDQGEFLDVFTATLDELLDWCRSGEVTDAKTLIGALWLQNMQAGAWPLAWQAAPPTSP
jgi:ADP-ribose pyrophosphatase